MNSFLEDWDGIQNNSPLFEVVPAETFPTTASKTRIAIFFNIFLTSQIFLVQFGVFKTSFYGDQFFTAQKECIKIRRCSWALVKMINKLS